MYLVKYWELNLFSLSLYLIFEADTAGYFVLHDTQTCPPSFALTKAGVFLNLNCVMLLGLQDVKCLAAIFTLVNLKP